MIATWRAFLRLPLTERISAMLWGLSLVSMLRRRYERRLLWEFVGVAILAGLLGYLAASQGWI
jgi:hypothetical protein